MKLWLTRPRTHLALATLLVCAWAITAHAQNARNNSLIKIGTIRDYPATGLMTGCGNLYFHQRGKSNPTDADFVFLARGDGSNAWMNLNGRDVRLRQIKTKSAKQLRDYKYSYGNWQITVAIEDLTAKRPDSEANPMYEMKITFRRGRSVRVIHAAGNSDC